MDKPDVRVFISYAHKDSHFFDVFKEGLMGHLYTSDQFDFGVWEDSQIYLGSLWDEEIQQNLSQGGIAILCVSSNFLNSNYIEAKEFQTLINNFPDTLIVPVYFNHCNINAWDDLSKRQFFKPSGEKYGKAGVADFSFCDLVKFRQTDGLLIPDANIDLYFSDLVTGIENALSNRLKGKGTGNLNIHQQNRLLIPAGSSTSPAQQNSLNKIVSIVIVGFMIMSALLIFSNLLSGEWNTAVMFKSSLGCVMFFGSLAAFMFNKNRSATI